MTLYPLFFLHFYSTSLFLFPMQGVGKVHDQMKVGAHAHTRMIFCLRRPPLPAWLGQSCSRCTVLNGKEFCSILKMI